MSKIIELRYARVTLDLIVSRIMGSFFFTRCVVCLLSTYYIPLHHSFSPGSSKPSHFLLFASSGAKSLELPT